ncbi:MAG: hypothetical protein WC838_05220, partial [Candidatus Margulisiibacteriota bacterium]
MAMDNINSGKIDKGPEPKLGKASEMSVFWAALKAANVLGLSTEQLWKRGEGLTPTGILKLDKYIQEHSGNVSPEILRFIEQNDQLALNSKGKYKAYKKAEKAPAAHPLPITSTPKAAVKTGIDEQIAQRLRATSPTAVGRKDLPPDAVSTDQTALANSKIYGRIDQPDLARSVEAQSSAKYDDSIGYLRTDFPMNNNEYIAFLHKIIAKTEDSGEKFSRKCELAVAYQLVKKYKES